MCAREKTNRPDDIHELYKIYVASNVSHSTCVHASSVITMVHGSTMGSSTLHEPYWNHIVRDLFT